MSINLVRDSGDPASKEKALESSCLTLSITGEDHTLGNALRSVLSSKLNVEFAGYSIPHPTLAELNFRLQVLNDEKAITVFADALDELSAVGKHVLEEFDRELETFQNRQDRHEEPTPAKAS